MIVGTVIILLGVAMVALTKGNVNRINVIGGIYTDEEMAYYKWMSIGLALSSGFLGAIRIF